ncbi:transmembrane amino acid transporter protein [Hirsutella rhossiliensis]|uniref:Transmembrane amino acid transporter protein n=1 Tax=Hirsutella rhossiliensis TaxID=111463 RepID=A0A9P8SL49_9HYPO|nr:transmembrane amino acid transporter protein [Hirsutella rhossiliensis]KAH0964776.1 transmembrane amino acid transporter protein [Hirsutella rhossiliensis]
MANSQPEPRAHQQYSPQKIVLEKGGLQETVMADSVSDLDKSFVDEEMHKSDGEAQFRQLGWKRLTVVLIVQSVALGSLSLPAAFATLGMVLGVFFCVSLGLVAIFTGKIIGEVKLKYPEVAHYADSGRLLFGKFGYELFGAMFAIQLILVVGSHTLTGTIAFLNLTSNSGCSAALGFASAIILLVLAIPPSFAEVAILGYVDCISIFSAIGIITYGRYSPKVP